MNGDLSTNTQAILLLTAPLIAGREKSNVRPLTPGEYKALVRALIQHARQPSDLIGPEAGSVIEECCAGLDRERIEHLLGRGFQLGQALERWRARSIWVVSRADPEYPARFKKQLGEGAPAVVYGCGDASILNSGGLAVVGSRNIDDELAEYTENVGRLAADSGLSIVSGGAKGIDQAAMRGALDRGGRAIGVLANGLDKAVTARDHREMLIDGRLVLISPYDPSVRFLVGYAMQRNKLIYALADAALVASSDYGKGGTWTGAVEQLEKLHFVPIYTRSTGVIGKGLEALNEKGAKPWPNPTGPDELRQLCEESPKQAASAPTQASLFSDLGEGDAKAGAEKTPT